MKLFEIPAIKFFNNLVVISTCAFTGYLFLSYLPDYVDGISAAQQYGLVAVVVLCAVLSSSDIKYVKILSVASTWLFFALIAGLWLATDMGIMFVINSLDSLIRLYTVNLNLTAENIGRRKYILGNWATMFGLILLYQFTPFKIEWVGLIVIALYGVVYVLLFARRSTMLPVNAR